MFVYPALIRLKEKIIVYNIADWLYRQWWWYTGIKISILPVFNRIEPLSFTHIDQYDGQVEVDLNIYLTISDSELGYDFDKVILIYLTTVMALR